MFALTNKTKQYLLAALKVFILGITFLYIYKKLTDSPAIGLAEFTTVVGQQIPDGITAILLFLALALANWFFESLKWKTVVSALQPLSIRVAARQCLASLTASLATPNRIGDYGAKALFYPPEKRKRIMVLNFFSNGAQMLTTVVFGILGLVLTTIDYGLTVSPLKIGIVGVTLLVIIIVGYVFKEKELLLKGLSLGKIIRYIKGISTGTKTRVIVFSVCRYLIFSYLFLKILRFFEADIAFSQAYPLIFSMYLLVSLLPSFFIFDVVIRGGVAVWLFSLAQVPEITVLATVLAMWLLNFGLPALVGSFYVISFKPATS